MSTDAVKRRYTMADLAKLAEVDVSTVSRALNNSPLVKQDTKDYILKIANDVGYTINASARNLRRQSSQTIGMVIPIDPSSGETISDPFFLEMIGAVSHAASQKGYDLIVSIPQNAAEISEQRILQSGRADGLIIIGQAGREDALNRISNLSTNIIVWGGQSEDTNYTLVGSDNQAGGYIATSHLLSLGRRNIAFLGDITLPEIKLRYEGYINALSDASLDVDNNIRLDIGLGMSAMDMITNIQELIQNNPQIDAIFAGADPIALQAIDALKAIQKKIPEDISIVGYDNVARASLSSPALTTIDQNIRIGGEKLVELLLRKINGDAVQSQLTPTHLIVRGSCGGT